MNIASPQLKPLHTSTAGVLLFPTLSAPSHWYNLLLVICFTEVGLQKMPVCFLTESIQKFAD